MIESKAQYEMRRIEAEGWAHHSEENSAVLQKRAGEALLDVLETTEALRRFVKAHTKVDNARIGAVKTLSTEEYNGLVQEFRDARDALPEWLLDG